MTTIYTIGYSRHPAERLVELLRAQEISLLVDVRSHPASKWAPHYERRAQAADFRPAWSGCSPSHANAGTAIMCAEEDPARCHRRPLVTPALERASPDPGWPDPRA